MERYNNIMLHALFGGKEIFHLEGIFQRDRDGYVERYVACTVPVWLVAKRYSKEIFNL